MQAHFPPFLSVNASVSLFSSVAAVATHVFFSVAEVVTHVKHEQLPPGRFLFPFFSFFSVDAVANALRAQERCVSQIFSPFF